MSGLAMVTAVVQQWCRGVAALAICLTLVSACDRSPEVVPLDRPATELIAGIHQDDRGLSSLSLDDVVGLLPAIAVEGLDIRHVRGENTELLYVVAESDRYRPVLRGLTTERPRGVTAGALMAEGDLQLLIGSSFVSELNALTPLGLLEIEDKQISVVQRHGYTRILGLNDRGFGVVDHLDYQRGLFHSALQAGPGVIEESQLDIASRDLQRTAYFRTLVGVCGDRAVFAVTLTPMHLYTVGRVLLEEFARHELACDEVVNLAGDRESVFAIRLADERVLYIGNPRTSKAALIGLVSR